MQNFHEVFTDDSPFVLEDNRRSRPILPTSARSLNAKHSQLLPQRVVQHKTVLDLGSCIGATGHWCCQLGASSYLGVEHQDGYVSLARRLLQDTAQAQIVKASAESYFAQSSARFDVVCLLGLVHGVFDPLAIIRESAARAKEYFCFDDVGWSCEAPLIQARPMLRMTLADQNASSIGFGWSISTGAMHAIMEFLGFKPDMAPVFLVPTRWICRYIRVRGENAEASFSSKIETWEELAREMAQEASKRSQTR